MANRTRRNAGSTGGTVNGNGGEFPPLDGANGNLGDGNTLNSGGDHDNGRDSNPGSDGNSPGGSQSPAGNGDTGNSGGNSNPGDSRLGTERPRRGRKPGSRNTQTSAPLDLSDEIQGGHMLVATVFGLPELVLDAEESKQLAKKLQRIQKEFDVKVNTKAVAIVSLIATAGLVYVPRAVAIFMRVKQEKADAAKKAQDAKGGPTLRIVPSGDNGEENPGG